MPFFGGKNGHGAEPPGPGDRGHRLKDEQSNGQAAPGTRHSSRGGRSFAARFGRVLLQHGIAAIPSALYHFQGEMELSAQQVWFVSYILSHKWDQDLPYPSLKKMARATGMSLSQLQRIKNSLCQARYLAVYPRYDDKQGQATNAYDFSGLFDALEEMITGQPPARNDIREDGSAPDMAELGEVDPSFAARYGRVITRHGVAAIPRAIFTHQAALKLTPQQVWFISYIFSFQWDTALPYPSIRRMATVTGYSSVQLHNIKNELVELGYLRLVRRSNDTGGQDTNAYDFSGLLDAARALLQPESEQKPVANAIESDFQASPRPIARRRGRRSASQDGGSTDLSRGDRRELSGGGSVQLPASRSTGIREGGSAYFTGRGSREFAGGDREGFAGGDATQLPGRDSAQLGGPGNGKRPAGTSAAYPRRVARGVQDVETAKVESHKRDDSNQPSQVRKSENGKNDTPPPYSPYIAAVVSDFSDELNNASQVISNVTQALRIWETSRLNEQQFTELMYEAKRLTRQYQGKQGLGTISNKMAYFFTVLRDLSRGSVSE